jgi:hypothetical protein
MKPFYVCEKVIEKTGLVPTRCQNKPPAGCVTCTPGDWYDSQIKATVKYELVNASGAYNDFQAKIDGSTCNYICSDVDGKFADDRKSCEIPNYLNMSSDAKFITG